MDPFEAPPASLPTNPVQVNTADSSKISNVSLYSTRAEITRLYQIDLKLGHNKVTITGLPTQLDQSSLKVEGRGSATIHDVTISQTPRLPAITTTSTLEALEFTRNRYQKAIGRYQKCLASLEKYLESATVQQVNISEMGGILEKYDLEAKKLDDKMLDLQQKVKEVEEDIIRERAKMASPATHNLVGLQVMIGVFASSEGEVSLGLVYVVPSAMWDAGYDIRVDMQTKEKAVKIIYKAAITQNTGEAWDDVPLTLETATPTFGVSVPKLSPWALSVYKPAPKKQPSQQVEESDDDMGFGIFDDPDQFDVHQAQASSKGHVSATFRIPGFISIPSDHKAHNVTIAQLELDAVLSWISVPKIDDLRTHLTAKIKNDSDYTFLAGLASIYVDGSFISKSHVPAVSPQESFDCPLGLDPSIRVTYHPRTKTVSTSGFYDKTKTSSYMQRITIFNTKPVTIHNLKIADQFPVSQNDQIAVKVISPPLSVSAMSESPVPISNGVVAQWEGADDRAVELSSLGKNGQFDWICSVPAQGKINLLMKWEVSAPESATVVGL